MLIFYSYLSVSVQNQGGRKKWTLKVRFFLFNPEQSKLILNIPFHDIPHQKSMRTSLPKAILVKTGASEQRPMAKEIRAGKFSDFLFCPELNNDRSCPQVDDVRCIGRKHLLALEEVLVSTDIYKFLTLLGFILLLWEITWPAKSIGCL